MSPRAPRAASRRCRHAHRTRPRPSCCSSLATSVTTPVTDRVTQVDAAGIRQPDRHRPHQDGAAASSPLLEQPCTAVDADPSPPDAAEGAPSPPSTPLVMQQPVCPTPPPQTPHRLRSASANAIVRVRGSAFCTGTPIAGTELVVTAAHCVLGTKKVGLSATSIVLADGTERAASAVFVNLDYHVAPSPRLRRPRCSSWPTTSPGPPRSISDQLPEHRRARRGRTPTRSTPTAPSSPRDETLTTDLLRNGATGPITTTSSAPAGCVLDRTELSISEGPPHGTVRPHPRRIRRGTLRRDRGTTSSCFGIISTVADDLSFERPHPQRPPSTTSWPTHTPTATRSATALPTRHSPQWTAGGQRPHLELHHDACDATVGSP